MVFKCAELPGREFKTQQEMFAELKRFELTLISLKENKLWKSCEKQQFTFGSLDISKITSGASKAPFEMKKGYVYPVISVCRNMDSHRDVHFDACFDDTVKDEQGSVCYALDHQLKYRDILAWPEDVTMFIAVTPWSVLGKSYIGETTCLVFEIPESAFTDKDILEDIKRRSTRFENSIRMIYVKVVLAMNSGDKDHAENKSYWDSRVGMIVNPEEAYRLGYFWGVEKLTIEREGSLVVAGGSNSATTIMIPEEESSKESVLPLSSQKSVWDYYI